MIPSKIEWDLTNGPLSKLLELLDTQVEGSVQWVLLEISWNDSLHETIFHTRTQINVWRECWNESIPRFACDLGYSIVSNPSSKKTKVNVHKHS